MTDTSIMLESRDSFPLTEGNDLYFSIAVLKCISAVPADRAYGSLLVQCFPSSVIIMIPYS